MFEQTKTEDSAVEKCEFGKSGHPTVQIWNEEPQVIKFEKGNFWKEIQI